MKMLDFVLFALIVFSVSVSTNCKQISYDNYKVFRIIPTTSEQIKLLLKLQHIEGYSFWLEPRGISNFVDLMVAPTRVKGFYELMKNASINYQLSIKNVQNLVNQQITSFNSRAGDENFDWTRYHTLDEIYYWMDQVVANHRDTVQKIIGGRTYQGRQIQGVRLRFGQEKPGIFIEGGMHGREWIAPATVTYLIDKLLNSPEPKVRRLAESHDWYIFPISNPDGYVYTYTFDRLWRKSLSDTGMGPNPYDPMCKGVDLNRNFGYQWQTESNPNNNPCTDNYPGYRAFSEIELISLTEFIQSLNGKLFAFISLHSFGQLLLFPYGHTTQHLDNYDESLAIAYKARAALSRRYGTRYRTGNIAETVYIATGSSIDWVKAVMRLPLCYGYEMRDERRYGFLLPPEQIIPNAEEILDSLVAMFREARKFGYPNNGNRDSASGSGSASRHGECSRSGSSDFWLS